MLQSMGLRRVEHNWTTSVTVNSYRSGGAVKVMCVMLSQSCPTLWDPRDCSPPGSSVHGISKARMLEWVSISFSRGSSQPRNRSWVFCIGRQILYRMSHQDHSVLYFNNVVPADGSKAPGKASAFSIYLFNLAAHRPSLAVELRPLTAVAPLISEHRLQGGLQ